MATKFSTETAPQGATPPTRVSDVAQRGRKKHLRNSIVLAAQATADVIYLGKRPAGSRMGAIEIVSDTSLATSTIAIGTLATPAKYKALAVFTAVDTPARVMLTAAAILPSLPADEDIYLSIAVAALPGAGNLVIDIEYIES